MGFIFLAQQVAQPGTQVPLTAGPELKGTIHCVIEITRNRIKMQAPGFIG